MAYNAAAYRYGYRVNDLKCFWIFWSVSRFLYQYIFFFIKQVNNTVFKTLHINAVAANVPQDIIHRRFFVSRTGKIVNYFFSFLLIFCFLVVFVNNQNNYSTKGNA